MEEKSSFWKKPEGIVTAILLVCVFVFGAGHFAWLTAQLASIAQNTFKTAVFLIGLVTLYWLISSKSIRTALFFLWRTALRKIIGIIIQTDPIAILKIRIEEAIKERFKIGDEHKKVDQQVGLLEKRILDNDKLAKEKIEFALSAEKQGELEAAQLAANFAAGLKEMNSRLQPLLNNLMNVSAILEKFYKNTGFVIEQMKNEVSLKEIEYNAYRAGSNALSSALKIFRGDPDKTLVYEQAMEYINNDMGKKIGEMKNVMKMTKEMMSNIDIQNGVLTERGQTLLNEFKNSKIINLNEIKADNSQSNILPSPTSKFSNLLKRN